MKVISQKILLTIMACLVLFTSSGFGLIEHSCKFNGKKTYAFVEKQSCCENVGSKKEGINRAKCCDTKSIKTQQNPQAKNTNNFSAKLGSSINELLVSSTKYVFKSFLNFILVHFEIADQDDPPTKSGASIVIALRQLRP